MFDNQTNWTKQLRDNRALFAARKRRLIEDEDDDEHEDEDPNSEFGLIAP